MIISETGFGVYREMFEDNKENRRKTFNNKKKKTSPKHRFSDDEDGGFKQGNRKYQKDNIKADEIWEEWNNRENE